MTPRSIEPIFKSQVKRQGARWARHHPVGVPKSDQGHRAVATAIFVFDHQRSAFGRGEFLCTRRCSGAWHVCKCVAIVTFGPTWTTWVLHWGLGLKACDAFCVRRMYEVLKTLILQSWAFCSMATPVPSSDRTQDVLLLTLYMICLDHLGPVS